MKMLHAIYCWIWLQMICHLHNTVADASAYSLQSALDELNYQEYPLNPYKPSALQRQYYYYNDGVGGDGNGIGNTLYVPSTDQDYWENENDGGRMILNPKIGQHNKLNKQLRKFLERDYYMNNNNKYNNNDNDLSLSSFDDYKFDEDANNKLLSSDLSADEQKRSSYFRERDNAYDDSQLQSIFRERGAISQMSNNNNNMNTNTNINNNDLGEKFLREMDDDRIRQNHYMGDDLENMLDKYHQRGDNDDNMINDNFHQLTGIDRDNRMRLPPYYMLMQKKRSYPVLPWLPYTIEHNNNRKQHVGGFPVSKRSALGNRLHDDNDLMKHKHFNDFNTVNTKTKKLTKTAKNVENELSQLFNDDHNINKNNNNVKRSINELNDQDKQELDPERDHEHSIHDKRKQNDDHNSNVPLESIKLTDMHLGMLHTKNVHYNHNHNHNDTSNKSNINQHQRYNTMMDSTIRNTNINNNRYLLNTDNNENNYNDNNKIINNTINLNNSINDHSNVDKKYNNYLNRNDPMMLVGPMANAMRQKKSIDWSKYFGLDRKKKSINDYENDKNNQKNLDSGKLDNMDMKLQALEDYIINDTIKYTGAHEGIDNPQQIRLVKNRVLSRLATAYNVEKMRQRLAKLYQATENDNHLLRNIIKTDGTELNNHRFNNHDVMKLMKKDKLNMPTYSVTNEYNNNNVKDDDNNNHNMKSSIMKKAKEIPMFYPEPSNDIDTFKLEDYLNFHPKSPISTSYSDKTDNIWRNEQCPLVESIIDHCHSVDLLSGDLNQALLQLCVLHQICYLCGTSHLTCDYQYLEEADRECGRFNNECQSAARSILIILRGSPALQLGSKECSKDICLRNIVREIGI